MFLIALLLFGGLMLLPLTASAHMVYYDGNIMIGSGLGGFFMVFFWILVVLFVVGIIRWSFGHRHGMIMPHGRSLEILKERYAKGEITKEQYESMRKDLMS